MRDALRASRLIWGLIALFTLGAGEARADVVGDGPEDCPDGSSPTACHSAEYCRTDTCTAESKCNDGKVCRDAMMCVHKDVCSGGSGTSTPVEGLVKTCTGAADCGEDTCEKLKLCVMPEEPTTGDPTGVTASSGASGSADTGTPDKKEGCGCRSEADPVTGLVAVTLLGLTLGRRRRR